MEQVELGWNDFWAEIFRIKHRRSIQGIQHYDKMVVDFCIEVLGLKDGGELLDIACGAGDQSVEFAKLGIKVTAFDISERLIAAAQECATNYEVSVNFFTGDMLKMSYDNQFNAAVLLSHSFGFFNHDENKQVLKDTHKALKEGGCLLLDLMNPYNIPKFMKTWTALEIRGMLEEAGFTKIEFYGQNKLPRMQYSSGSERMVVVASK